VVKRAGTRRAVRRLRRRVRLRSRIRGALGYPVPPAPDPRFGSLDLRGVDPHTRFTILLGDHDTVVDGAGARQMLTRLASAGFPGDRISLTVVKSHGRFVVTHLAPLEVSPAAKTAWLAPCLFPPGIACVVLAELGSRRRRCSLSAAGGPSGC